MATQASLIVPKEEDGRQKILFGNPEFKKDLNFTVRFGGSYAIEREIEVGRFYPLYTVGQDGMGGEYLGDGEVTHILSCRLKDIPKMVYANEHDEECRNPIGLYWELMQVYPDKTIDPYTFMTCIGFVVRQ